MQTILWSHPANKVKSSKFLSSEIEPIVGKPQFVHRMMNFTANRRRMRSFLHSTCKRSASSFDSVLGKWKVFQGCLYIQRQSLENETDRRRGSDSKFPRISLEVAIPPEQLHWRETLLNYFSFVAMKSGRRRLNIY